MVLQSLFSFGSIRPTPEALSRDRLNLTPIGCRNIYESLSSSESEISLISVNDSSSESDVVALVDDVDEDVEADEDAELQSFTACSHDGSCWVVVVLLKATFLLVLSSLIFNNISRLLRLLTSSYRSTLSRRLRKCLRFIPKVDPPWDGIELNPCERLKW